jgi:hypothetical protein
MISFNTHEVYLFSLYVPSCRVQEELFYLSYFSYVTASVKYR